MHCYDGNHNNKDVAVRRAEVDETDKKVADIMGRLTGDGICCELAVAGGTPSFPCHAGATRWYLLSLIHICIHELMKARYGPDYGLYIESRIGYGTKVFAVFPYRRGSETC